MNTNTETKTVISYHTFIFPFLWKIGSNGNVVTIDKFEQCIHPGWNRDVIADRKGLSEFYAQYRYFNPAARNAIYDDGRREGIVRNYRFDMKSLDGKKSENNIEKEKEEEKNKSSAIFTIRKTFIRFKNLNFDENKRRISKIKNRSQTVSDKKCIKKSLCMTYSGKDYKPSFCLNIESKNKIHKKYNYALKINGIRMKLFNSGIGMIIYELENYDYHKINDINRINDFGRRLYMPYKNNFNRCNICADSISISYQDIENTPEKATKVYCWNSKISGAKESDNPLDMKLPVIVTNFLTNDRYTVTTAPQHKKKSGKKKVFYIEPVIGDRMYVACVYQNKEFANKVSEWRNDKYAYLDDAVNMSLGADYNYARKLYEFIFVDGDGITCLNKNMVQKLLEDHVYDRWIEYGTITGITEYSIVMLTTLFGPATSTPFLTEYIEMAILALAQRASLIVFERLISDSALKKQNIKKIQKDYIIFQSQLLLQEVTPEQQGIEIYKELVESLFIERNSEQIEKQISALFDLKNYENDSVESIILFALAMLGVTEVIDCFADWVSLSDFLNNTEWARFGPSVAIIALCSLAYWILKKKK